MDLNTGDLVEFRNEYGEIEGGCVRRIAGDFVIVITNEGEEVPVRKTDIVQ